MSHFLLEFTLRDPKKAISPLDILNQIEHQIDNHKNIPKNRALIVYGPPGIGKSWIAAEAAKLLEKRQDQEKNLTFYFLNAAHFTGDDGLLARKIEHIKDECKIIIIDSLESLFICPSYYNRRGWQGSWESFDATDGSRELLKNLNDFFPDKKRKNSPFNNKLLIVFIESFTFYLIRADIYKKFDSTASKETSIIEFAVGQTFGKGIQAFFDKAELEKQLEILRKKEQDAQGKNDNSLAKIIVEIDDTKKKFAKSRDKSDAFNEYIVYIIRHLDEDDNYNNYINNILNLISKAKNKGGVGSFIELEEDHLSQYQEEYEDDFVHFCGRIGLLAVEYYKLEDLPIVPANKYTDQEYQKGGIKRVGMHKAVIGVLAESLDGYFPSWKQRFLTASLFTFPLSMALTFIFSWLVSLWLTSFFKIKITSFSTLIIVIIILGLITFFFGMIGIVAGIKKKYKSIK